MHTTVDKFGRILIPKKLRQQLGLKPNDTLELTLVDDKLMLTPEQTAPALWHKGRVLVVDSEATTDLTEAAKLIKHGSCTVTGLGTVAR